MRCHRQAPPTPRGRGKSDPVCGRPSEAPGGVARRASGSMTSEGRHMERGTVKVGTSNPLTKRQHRQRGITCCAQMDIFGCIQRLYRA
jgi:hypothetical protein